MTRVLGLLTTACLAAAALYVSEFWVFRLWEGRLWDVQALRPGGDVLAFFLRGTDARPFALIIWAVLVFLFLTLCQWIWARIFKS